ncbi:MAG TPA: nucleoside-diphosphate sugar epimerase/dehydratase [Candidatus Methanoperedens sp.]|nr:nucleoside-diphosphate sugar epimerase/dehydratase [Candidatus Methanoperedens sp.]
MTPLRLSRRRIGLLLIDAAVFALCFYLAFAARFESFWPAAYARALLFVLPLAVLSGVAGMLLAGVYRSMVRYTSTKDLLAIIRGGLYAAAILVVAVVFTHGLKRFPRSVFILFPVFGIGAVGGSRLAWRLLAQRRESGAARAPGRSVLIVGAGDAADGLIRELRQNPRTAYRIVGIVDDDPHKRSQRIHGVEVGGGVDEIPALARASGAEEILIAIPSASGAQMRRIVALCRESGVPYRTVPGLGDILEGRVHVRQLRRVRIDDLLRRPPVRLDRDAISAHLRDRRVLVTGAGGSIGAELCRQIARFAPAELILVDHAENGLFHADEELRGAFPWLRYELHVAEATAAAPMRRIMERRRPHVVFHAAAHKHVPLMESNRHAAFANNVGGTRTVAEAAAAAGAARFVLISSDKAVNPTSAMGASKRIAELVVQSLAAAGGSATEFCSVRFGNVMGSAGSVIPLFAQQIEAGGPVTVTHPDAVRYFMTIPEAAQLVLQAGTLGRGGEIFLLDMGEPLRIADLARDMIRLSGLEPETDIELKYIGLRRGEKLSEELITAGEGVAPTAHEKVMVLRADRIEDREGVLARARRVEELAAACAPEEQLMAAVRALVPEYREAPA